MSGGTIRCSVQMTQPSKIRILVVDDHPLVRRGIASILANEEDMELVAEAADGQEGVRKFLESRPDVVLMDLRMPRLDGIEAARLMREQDQEACIVALTSYDGDQNIYRALEVGMRGYLLKELVHAEVVHAIRSVHAGERWMPVEVTDRLNGFFPRVALTPREVEVLRLVARGFANKEIAGKLGTAVGTMKMHVQSILAKLEASDRTHAVTIAVERGILHLDCLERRAIKPPESATGASL
jgi:DNA-binding NarL/FixJ family response regulator